LDVYQCAKFGLTVVFIFIFAVLLSISVFFFHFQQIRTLDGLLNGGSPPSLICLGLIIGVNLDKKVEGS